MVCNKCPFPLCRNVIYGSPLKSPKGCHSKLLNTKYFVLNFTFIDFYFPFEKSNETKNEIIIFLCRLSVAILNGRDKYYRVIIGNCLLPQRTLITRHSKISTGYHHYIFNGCFCRSQSHDEIFW